MFNNKKKSTAKLYFSHNFKIIELCIEDEKSFKFPGVERNWLRGADRSCPSGFRKGALIERICCVWVTRFQREEMDRWWLESLFTLLY